MQLCSDSFGRRKEAFIYLFCSNDCFIISWLRVGRFAWWGGGAQSGSSDVESDDGGGGGGGGSDNDIDDGGGGDGDGVVLLA